MKLSIIALLALLFAAAPVTLRAQEEQGPAARCNGHMCPVARAATQTGHETLVKLALTNVSAGEFLS